jgi:hypothetical protein
MHAQNAGIGNDETHWLLEKGRLKDADLSTSSWEPDSSVAILERFVCDFSNIWLNS